MLFVFTTVIRNENQENISISGQSNETAYTEHVIINAVKVLPVRKSNLKEQNDTISLVSLT